MKNLKLIVTVLIMTIAFSATAQKVKIKKDIASVDGVAYLDLTDCSALSCTFKTMTGVEVMSVQWESFKKPNPVKTNPGYRGPTMATVTQHYAIINFFDFDLEFETELASKKGLVKELYKNKVVLEDGSVSKENALRFSKKFGKDVSGTRPLQIIKN